MFSLISEIINKKTSFVGVPLGLGVFGARLLKVFTLGKLDYVEKVQRMGENRSFSHDSAERDFGYQPMPLREGLKLEIEDYLKIKK